MIFDDLFHFCQHLFHRLPILFFPASNSVVAIATDSLVVAMALISVVVVVVIVIMEVAGVVVTVIIIVGA